MQGWTESAVQLSVEQFDHDDQDDFTQDDELSHIIMQSMSLLGFLDAAAEHATFWTAYDQLRFVETVQQALSEDFLIAFETALSVVRNARPHQHRLRHWKQHAKHYAAIGRPLGAMILHDSFLKVIVACASGIVHMPDRDPKSDVLDSLRVHKGAGLLRDASTDALAEGLTRIAAEEMDRLDNDLDYLQRVGSAWQQRQASAVKAKVIATCVCCAVYNENVADSDALMTWLDTALNDPAQASDLTLASTVLKSMAILAKLSPTVASSLGRSLPRIIVQSGFDQQTASVAAECLASVLSLLPQDVIITTLYSLGNVISAGPAGDRNSSATPTLTNGHGKVSRSTGLYSHQHEGSAISLASDDIEAPNQAHTTVIETIVSVARKTQDEKITALALSMLVQKVGWISKVVDAKIVTDSALLGIHSGSGEFRSLLKLYSKLCHDALVKDDRFTLEAVSTSA